MEMLPQTWIVNIRASSFASKQYLFASFAEIQRFSAIETTPQIQTGAA